MLDRRVTPALAGITAMSYAEESFVDRAIEIAQGAAEPGVNDREARAFKRLPHEAWVMFVEVTPTGERLEPLTLRAIEISAGGMSLQSATRVEPGCRGAVMISKSTGEPAVLGVLVVHCRPSDRMNHECGVAFGALPQGVTLADFQDVDGRTGEAEAA